MINKYIDHTNLKPDAEKKEIEKLCNEAVQYGFFAVCVNPSSVKYSTEILKGSGVKVCTVIGFPLGYSKKEVKIKETEEALKDGADEFDMVINIADLKSGSYDNIESEIKELKNIVGTNILKVIVETCYLTPEEIKKASQISVKAGADFVKTSTGFGTRGASIEDIDIIKEALKGSSLKIKASGGIKDRKTAEEYINRGVCRIGTSSGVKIAEEILIKE